ncbi:hypothetical protein [Pseudoalteromonas luteoviolacea]|uniref:Lipoprotein n=1 Tax=Pseudoalteromonas luteoviolacea H33 TaxID=1365251 RepID=A0A167G6W3_9GAMM|nr:hypothetical protein [Pseudoalteromonas luteoviolacea]KZN54179.1 hypothetical protein N476_08265 [Pseudoalteromonas luteoviolacea H33]KZN78290.1 hypothetical protein N477_09260 [Pseudoalteromonas luteoviolacea H33-S]MBQ4877456.1 hypothetical protein [Pseudoalteromonas luteoviolacea]MBQ4906445.1 hypothetical protein [Pseudoalteromonas luteoviolacea]
MKMFSLGLASVVLMLSGCNSTSDSTETAKSSNYRCEQVRALGSNIPKKRCTTRQQRQEEKRRSDALMRDAQIVRSINDE